MECYLVLCVNQLNFMDIIKIFGDKDEAEKLAKKLNDLEDTEEFIQSCIVFGDRCEAEEFVNELNNLEDSEQFKQFYVVYDVPFEL